VTYALDYRRLAALEKELEDCRAKLSTIEFAQGEPIAIVGVGLNMPGRCDSLAALEKLLHSENCARTLWPDESLAGTQGRQHRNSHYMTSALAGGLVEDVDAFDARFFSISPREARCIDPQQRILMQTAWHALEDANINPDTVPEQSGAVFIGASANDYSYHLSRLTSNKRDSYMSAGISLSAISGRLSYFLGWNGPSVTVDTACSSSLVAIHQAVCALRRRECNLALAGGVSIISHPFMHSVCEQANMLSPEGLCKTFDDSANGYGRSEGCGVVVLKRLSDVKADKENVYALIRGSSVNQDGKRSGLTVPNGKAQERVMNNALKDAGLCGGDISYVEAHGTGTPLGDPIELSAIDEAIGCKNEGHTLTVGSVKTNLGHMEAAAGVGGLLKVICQLRTGTVYKHLHFCAPSRNIPWQRLNVTIPGHRHNWDGNNKRAVINSFGFSGTLASLVVEQWKGGHKTQQNIRDRRLVTISAKSQEALIRLLRSYAPALTGAHSIDDLCLSTQWGRKHHKFRFAVIPESIDTLQQSITAAVAQPKEFISSTNALSALPVRLKIFGKQTRNLGALRELCEAFKYFNEAVASCLAVLDVIMKKPAALYGTVTFEQFEGVFNAGYLNTASYEFIVHYACAKCLMSAGIVFDEIVCDEYNLLTAMCLAEALTVKEAITLLNGNENVRQKPLPLVDVLAEKRVMACPVRCVTNKAEREQDTFITEVASLNAAFGSLTLEDRAIHRCVEDNSWYSIGLDAFISASAAAGKPTAALFKVFYDRYRQGDNLNWQHINADVTFTFTPLPRYPFETTRYWITP
jgi:Polyketide synthase modules and related proteins